MSDQRPWLAGPPDMAGEVLDRDLLVATRAGDATAYEELFRRHRRSAMGLASRYAWTAEDREDIVAQAFTDIWQAIQGGRGPVETFRPYLLSCVRRLGAAHVTRQSRRVDTLSDEALQVPDTTGRGPESVIEDDLVAAAFQSLPERWQLALWHAVVEDEPLASVGGRLGVGTAAAGELTRRAKEGLRVAYLAQHLARGEQECGIPRERLAGFVRGRLSARQEAEVRSHLATCPHCRESLAELGSVDQAMRLVVAPAIMGVPLAAYQQGVRAVGGGWWSWVSGHVVPLVVGAAAVIAAVVIALLVVPDAAPPLAAATPTAAAPSPASATAGTASGTPGADADSSSPGVDPTPGPGPTPVPGPSVVQAAHSVGGTLSQAVFAAMAPGEEGVLQLSTTLNAAGTLRITVPQHVRVATERLGGTCTQESDTQVACQVPTAATVFDVPVVVSADAPRGAYLGGGSAEVQLADGTEIIGPVALVLHVPADPC